MNDMSFASLSPGLLARKGSAKPAMRRQSPMVDSAVAGAQAHLPQAQDAKLDDLGWNDLGEPHASLGEAEPRDTQPVAAEHAVQTEHANDAEDNAPEDGFARLGQHARSTANPAPEHDEPDEAAEAQPEAADMVAAKVTAIHARAPRLPRPRLAVANASETTGQSQGKRTAFTLRLDQERHLKLRLACTLANRSAQALVTEAVDALFAATPELEQLVARVQSRPHKEG